MDIQIDRFKDYKVVKNPEAAKIIDSSINKEWWNNDGWSTMYDYSTEEFKKLLPSWDKGISYAVNSISFKQPSEGSDKLQGVFDFLEKKEGKPNPLKAESKTTEMFSNPKSLYAGKLGFGYINDNGKIQIFPYPMSGTEIENTGELKSYIVDIKDGGVMVWNDALEREYDSEDYII